MTAEIVVQPRRRAASIRRCPATSSYPPATRRTTTGCSRPYDSSDAASSSTACTLRRTFRPVSAIADSGICFTAAAAARDERLGVAVTAAVEGLPPRLEGLLTRTRSLGTSVQL